MWDWSFGNDPEYKRKKLLAKRERQAREAIRYFAAKHDRLNNELELCGKALEGVYRALESLDDDELWAKLEKALWWGW